MQNTFILAAALVAASSLGAQSVQGPSSSRTPYLQVSDSNSAVLRTVVSIVTATDLVPTTGALSTPYEVAGLCDGLGCFDNGDGTVTILMNHEINTSSGVIRRHGATGAFVSELLVDKSTLTVISAQDLTESFVDIDGVVRNVANGNPIALGRFCSADLAPVSAFYNSASGLGTQDRVFMNGEEGGATGYAVAHVATGAEKGTSYLLRAFNLATSGIGINAVGAWENVLANPLEQDLTVVAGTNDGGSNVMEDTVTVYVGQKQSTGNVVEKAGLMNGTSYLVQVVGNPLEIVDTATRATNIVSGTRFTLELATSTTWSRPEDGAWDPTNPNDFYFVTTDRLDTVTSTGFNQTIGASGPVNQIGQSRLWRLRFDDIRNPLLGGRVDLIIDGAKGNQKVNMLDNMCVADDGLVYLTEDPGNSTYIAKTWAYDPASDTLVQVAKCDEARWGDLAVNGGTPGAIPPYNNNKEISGVIDVSSMFAHAADEQVLLIDVQDHSRDPAVATVASVEGGQLLLMRVAARSKTQSFGNGCGVVVAASLGSTPKVGSTLFVDVDGLPSNSPGVMMLGASNVSIGAQTLPIDLGAFGAPGCSLYQDIAFGVFNMTASMGATSAIFTLPIPNAFELVGATVYLQAFSADANANALGLVFKIGRAHV